VADSAVTRPRYDDPRIPARLVSEYGSHMPGSRRSISRLAATVVLAILATAGQSSSQPTVVGGRMELLGSTTTWQLLMSNTGTETIRCLRVVAPPGVTFTRVVGPAGTVASGTEFSNRQLAVGPGVTFHETFTINTSAALTPAAPPRVYISADCAVEVEALVVVRDVTPTADPCTCRRLTVGLPRTLGRLHPAKRSFDLDLAWTMRCSQGDDTCLGSLVIGRPRVLPAPAGPAVRIGVRKREFFCRAPCSRTTNGRVTVTGVASQRLSSLFGRTLAFDVTTRCSFVTRRVTLRVRVDARGVLHPAR
jgi:hypothetical protein